MPIELIENKRGAAAFITPVGAPHLVLMVPELETNRATNKIAGQLSLPKETVEEGEDFESALNRLVRREEVQIQGVILPTPLSSIELCRVQVTDYTWVRYYLMEVSRETVILPGSAKDVYKPYWESILKIYQAPLYEYRSGDREAIKSYVNYLTGRSNGPDIYYNAIDRIPEEQFDRLEVTQRATLFQPSVSSPL